MIFKAFVKDKETGENKFIESDYPSKSDFITDLKHNGYSVSRAEPKDLYDFVMDNFDGDKYEWEVAKKLYKEGKPLTKEEFEKMKNGDDNDYEVVNDFSIDAIKDNFTPPGAKGEKKRRIVATDNPNWKWDNEDIARRFMAIPLVGGAYENNDPETAKEYYKQLKKMPIEELVNERDLANTMRFEGEDEPEWAKEKDNEVLNPTYSSLFGSEAPYANMESILDEWDKEDVKDAIDTNDNGKIEKDEMADFQKSLDDYAAKNKKGREDIPATYKR